MNEGVSPVLAQAARLAPHTPSAFGFAYAATHRLPLAVARTQDVPLALLAHPHLVGG